MNNKRDKTGLLTLFTVLPSALLGILLLQTSCHDETDTDKPRIESIQFDKESLLLKINSETTVKVTARSEEAKKYETIAYTSTNDGVIEIKEKTNDGFIVKGLRNGATVIMAKSQNVTSYLEVVVSGEEINIPFINVSQPVIEIMINERRSTQVSLYNGNILDNNNFLWKLENGKDNISIDVTANIAVITGLEQGMQKIIVSHPKAEYESEIIVFVKGLDEVVQYISSLSNVILLPIDGQYHHFSMSLVNGKHEDNINFLFSPIEGEGNITIEPNANVCNIRGLHSGSSLVRVTHPDSVNDFDVRIIIYDVTIPFITLEKTFVVLSIAESVTITATVENAHNQVAGMNEFEHEVIQSVPGVVEVIQTNNQFYVRGLSSGNARVIISNRQTDIARELLVIVRDEVIYRDDYYITTTQNVITTQVGAKETQLNMQLINGVPADANGFEWVVDDGTVVTVESAHGVVMGNRAVINSIFNAIAVITPKKAGTAKITISHPKSENIAMVMVKVYPAGVFIEPPVAVGVKNPDGTTKGLFTVVRGTPQSVQLEMISGDAGRAGALQWSTANTGIATVSVGVQGMTNILNGVGNGLTRLTVNGTALSYPYEPLVLAGTEEYIDNTSVIYLDSIYEFLVTGQVVRIRVHDSQNRYTNDNTFTARVTDKDLLYAVMIKNELVLQGKEYGETTVIIDHPNAINSITLTVRIDPAYINIDKPYFISGPALFGVACNVMKPLTVGLVNAGGSEDNNINWSVDDSNIATVMANGREGFVTGRILNQQTKVRVTHPKAENERVVLVYVVANESELYNKIVLGTDKENILITKGENKLLSLITNADDMQKLAIEWNVAYGEHDVIELDRHYDSAMIRATGAGNARIEVSHPENILPLTIFVSVVEGLSGEKLIKGPAIIEVVPGESRIVSVSHANLDQADINNIRWSVEDKSLANVDGNGDTAYILGLKEGISYVNIAQQNMGYQHRATLVSSNSPVYVMGVDQSYHTMVAGDEKKIRLSFGSLGFPEAEKPLITWKPQGSGENIRIAGQGESVTIIAINPGRQTVLVEHPQMFNKLEIEFEVHSANLTNYVFGNYDKIIGLVVGDPQYGNRTVTMQMIDGGTPVTQGLSQIEYDNDDHTVVTVNQTGSGNVFDLISRGVGQSFVTIRHPLVTDPARILIYTANSLDELAAYYPVVSDKTHYLLQVGESATVRINTITERDSIKPENQVETNISALRWDVENATVLENLINNGKKEAVIQGKYPGTAVININHFGKTVERIFVTVVSHDAVDLDKYIVTENIIGLTKGQVRSTEVYTNLSAGDISSLIWESSDTNVVTVSGTGKTATITAKNFSGSSREAYVTVSYGSWLKRHILVYVCDTVPQVQTYKAMNIEDQYIRLGRNEQAVLPLFFAPVKSDQGTIWNDVYQNKVVRMTQSPAGDRIEVTAINEGIAVLEAMNLGLSNPSRVVRVYVEVSDRYTNITKVPEIKYLTAVKTVYLLNPDEHNPTVELSVNGIGMSNSELAMVKWDIISGGHLINHYPNGRNCEVRLSASLGSNSGDATIRASSSGNWIDFKVIVSRSPLRGYPHIVPPDGDGVIRIGWTEKQVFEFNIAEIAAYDKNRFTFQIISGNSIIGVNMTGNLFEIEGKSTGQALLKISHPDCTFPLDVLVLVTSTPNGLIYLTTGDNFSVVKRNEYKTLSVEMVGFNPPTGEGYTWTLDPGHDKYIDLNYSGKQAQVRGKEAGTATIRVRHNNISSALYDLVMYVRVTELYINPVYITTPNNIISTVVGRSSYVQVNLANADPVYLSEFTFSTTTGAQLEVQGSGSQAVVLGKGVGIGEIIVSHPLAINNGMKIIVVVEEDKSDSGIYITTDTTLVNIRPQESHDLMVRLVGGKPEDIYGFKWQIVSEHAYDDTMAGTGMKVLNLVANASDRASIVGIREGEATLLITHPRTNYGLTIHVYVRLYSSVRFVQRNAELSVGEIKMIDVEVPTGVGVTYAASKPQGQDIVSLSATTSSAAGRRVLMIEGLKPGITIVGVSTISGTMMSDEILVEVKEAVNKKNQLIYTSDIIYNMTDWQSALNRSVISAVTMGEKTDGTKFTPKDDELIEWEVIDKGVVGLGYNSPFGATETTGKGKMISVYSIKAGTARIRAKHPDMPNYEKIVYMYVTPYDANFNIDPHYVTSLEIGKETTITAFISNVMDPDYTKVVCTISGGIKFKGYPEDKKTFKLGELDRSITVVGVMAGPANVRMTFNEMPPAQECNIFVEPERKLTLNGQTYFEMLPDERVVIPYEVLPAGTPVNFKATTSAYLDIVDDTFTNSLFKKDFSGELDGALRLVGGTREGVTQIELNAGGLQQMITVVTTFNYNFHITEGPSVIRGQPNTSHRVKYKIHPPGSEIVCVNEDLKGLVEIEFFPGNDEMIVHLKRAGYIGLEFEKKVPNTYGNNVVLKVPVYIYYRDGAPHLQWVGINVTDTYPSIGNKIPPNKRHSRMDNFGQAVYIADGEALMIDFRRSVGRTSYLTYVKNSPDYDAAGYPGLQPEYNVSETELNTQLAVQNITNKYVLPANYLSGNQTSRKSVQITPVGGGQSGTYHSIILACEMNNFVSYNPSSASNYFTASTTGYDYVLEVKYMGLLEIQYSHHNGGETAESFTKKLMVYWERWARVP